MQITEPDMSESEMEMEFNSLYNKEEEKLDAYLPAVDVGVSIGIPSTANYLCLLFGIPIIIFQGFDRTGFFSTDEAWNEDNGFLVTKKELNGAYSQVDKQTIKALILAKKNIEF